MKQILSFAILVLTAATVLSQTTAPPSAVSKPAVARHRAAHESEGQRIFEENCSRCHNAPNGFSPHITGTVLRHMRVRASLSAHDEKELLRFFNP